MKASGQGELENKIQPWSNEWKDQLRILDLIDDLIPCSLMFSDKDLDDYIKQVVSIENSQVIKNELMKLGYITKLQKNSNNVYEKGKFSSRYNIFCLEANSFSEEDWIELNRFENNFSKEAWPGEPMVTPTFTKKRCISSNKKCWITKKKSGRIVATLTYSETDFLIQVEKSSRKNCISKNLLALLLEHALKNNFTLLSTFTGSNVPAGDEMLAHIGGRLVTRWTESELFIPGSSDLLLKEWSEKASKEEYEVFFLIGEIPEQYQKGYAKLFETFLNTRPKDDLKQEYIVYSEEDVKKKNKQYQDCGHERWNCLIKHKATDILVGYFETLFHPDDNIKVEVGSTAVLQNHQGKGLAKLMHSEMISKIKREKIDAKTMITGTALSNKQMNRIYELLGFRIYLRWNAWQIATDAIRKYLNK
ncbi:MAG: GNAT family N-acetyltransferase [Oligoflexia bacterium]|nr:GNAT family N-acetyltransferase [Oligoflexia bacterium]MBF0363990.1 GNAT family N-acetyltransferase [Oligoflexia bacterium]